MNKDYIPEKTNQLISGYDLKLIAPPCFPGSDKWKAEAHLQDNISDVLPYVNAELKGADYNHNSKILIWEDKGKKYALRSYEIAAAPVEDREEADTLIKDVIVFINKIWERRHEISPDFEQKKLPAVMDIYKLLPKTNCRECGYATCMAYAADLRKGKTTLSGCPHWSEENKNNLWESLKLLF